MNIESHESERSIDYLTESLDYDMRIDSRNLGDFPRVTEEDLVSGQEKYIALIGNWSVRGDKVHIDIKGIIETNNSGSKNEVEVDFNELQETLRQAKLEGHQVANLEIIGEVHTHPKAEDSSHLPSPTDVEQWIQHYANGEFSSSKPFVFGISSRRKNNKGTLAFYRIVKNSKGELVPKAFNNWDWD
ncbi:Mov34/MPN/PAD-1 family protein [Candidatus Nomurabacteria bacterium]|nr:Mov34/MPN/PAD-1 family protein [Candidatus Nomurabacteria bacterium]